MSDEFHFKGAARCVWVEPNNGIIKSTFEPEASAAGFEYVHINSRKDRGTPEVGQTYWVEVRLMPPH